MLRTQFSMQASDLAAAFNASVGRMRLAPGNYAPELTAPEGPSTGGGVQALQRLRLIPMYPQYPILVVGSANQKEGTAELRTFEHVDAVHRHRFKRPVMLDRAQYEQFAQQTAQFLQAVRLRVTVAGPPVDLGASTGETVAPPPPSNRGLLVALLVVGILILLVVVAAVLFFFLYWRTRGVT